MPIFNIFKPILLSCCLSLLSLHVEATPSHHADKVISQLYHTLNSNQLVDMPTRLDFISSQFLEKPYLLGALGEGPQGDYDQSPLYRVDAFDCETFVDTVLALARSTDANQFEQGINQVRYRDGHVSYIDRNHFTCLDWNLNNQHQGFVKDITTTFQDKHHQPIVQFASAVIDKPSWYSRKTVQTIRLNHSNEVEQRKRLAALKREGSQLQRATATIPYLPLSLLFNHKGKANQHLFRQIPHAAIIEIIRPNWDLSREIGTHLNVSHLGFAFWKKDTLMFRQASSSLNRVVDVPLIDYLRNVRKSPTIKGINIQIVLPSQ